MKGMLKKIGTTIVIILVVGFVIDTGSVSPPDNALVFLDPTSNIYYPPTRTPNNSGYIATSYTLAKSMGAKPDDYQGFNTDGPPLIISFFVSLGIIKDWPTYWAGTKTPIEYYKVDYGD